MERRGRRIREGLQHLGKEAVKHKNRIGLIVMAGWVGITAAEYIEHTDLDTKNAPAPEDGLVTEILPGGATYTREIRQEPRNMIIHTIEVDSIDKKYDFVLDPDPPNDRYEAGARSVIDASKEYPEAFVTSNGPFFEPVRGGIGGLGSLPTQGQGVDVLGQMIWNGEEISPPQEGHGVLCIDSHGDISIVDHECGEDTITAIPGKHILLREGQIVDHNNDSIHPRMAFGSGEDNKFIMVGVDGRWSDVNGNKISEGATLQEMAEILRQRGAEYVLEMDGGGSASMVTRWTPESSPEIVNYPSDRLLGIWRKLRNIVPLWLVPKEVSLAADR